jgi:hypothetical protein
MQAAAFAGRLLAMVVVVVATLGVASLAILRTLNQAASTVHRLSVVTGVAFVRSVNRVIVVAVVSGISAVGTVFISSSDAAVAGVVTDGSASVIRPFSPAFAFGFAFALVVGIVRSLEPAVFPTAGRETLVLLVGHLHIAFLVAAVVVVVVVTTTCSGFVVRNFGIFAVT